MGISVIIITRDEEKNIKECINTLDFANEIIVVDNNSQDKTVDIAKAFGAAVYKIPGLDFSYLRNVGKEKAKSEWLLYVDADERISDPLAEEIKTVVSRRGEFSAFTIVRKNYYLGKLWPKEERIIRLIRKEALIGWQGILHETPIVVDEVGRLKSPLLHYTHNDLSSMVGKTNEWSEIEAELRFRSNHPKMSWWRFFRVMFTAFFRSYIWQGGYKIGTVGLVESIYQAFSIFITYAKLWEKQNKQQLTMDKITGRLRIGIYSPYLHILGGGERYLLTIAESLSRNHQVSLYADPAIRKKAESIFAISLDRVDFLPEVIFDQKNAVRKYASFSHLDIFFHMTDGSLFFPPAKKNFLIIQSPVHIPSLSFLNKLKLRQWRALCYSKFMQEIIFQRLKKESFILPPAIDVKNQRHDNKKKDIILTVGRFFPFPHNKKQDFLLSVFKKYYKKYFSGWKLIIAGGLTEKGGEILVDKLKKETQGFPVEILVNVPHLKLKKLYNQAKIYWHAAGFGEDIEKHPERTEHFGITVIEAMAAKVVPLVFNAGGPKEVVSEGKNGYIWNTEEELIKKTTQLVNNNNLLNKLSIQAELEAAKYTYQKFYEKLQKIID